MTIPKGNGITSDAIRSQTVLTSKVIVIR